VINIDEVIYLLEPKIVWLRLVGLLKNSQHPKKYYLALPFREDSQK